MLETPRPEGHHEDHVGEDGREYRQSIPSGDYGRGHIVTTGYGTFRITGEPHHESYGYLWRAVDVRVAPFEAPLMTRRRAR